MEVNIYVLGFRWSNILFKTIENIYLFILKIRERERLWDLPSIGLFPDGQQWGQAKDRMLELLPGLSQGPKHLGHVPVLFPGY